MRPKFGVNARRDDAAETRHQRFVQLTAAERLRVGSV
jgi:hypothetical protein